MKKCVDCGHKKALTFFGKYKASTDGHKAQCRACIAIYNRDYKKRTDGIGLVRSCFWSEDL